MHNAAIATGVLPDNGKKHLLTVDLAPSEGRGHRFEPCRARHFAFYSDSYLGPPTLKLRTNAARRGFPFLGETPRNGISSRKRGRVKMGSTFQVARCFTQSLLALGRFSESLKQGYRCYTATTTVLMRVPYRRFPNRTSGNGGTFPAPDFPHCVANRPEMRLPDRRICWHLGTAFRQIELEVPIRPVDRITRRALPVLCAQTAALCGLRAASLQRFALIVTRLTLPDFHHSGSSSIQTMIVMRPSSSSSAGNSDS